MTLKIRKRHRDAFKWAFEVCNINTGHTVSFHDDGCAKDGSPNQQRTAAFKKVDGARDEDGDPIFALPGAPPAWMLDNEHDGRGGRPLSVALAKLSDPSKNPKFKTLGEKMEHNRKTREEAEKRAAEAGLYGGRGLPPVIQQLADNLAAAVNKGGAKGKAATA